MPTDVDLPGLDKLLASGAQLVEVLPRNEYDEEHLPGAISLPLKDIDASTVTALDRGPSVVAYCWDAL
jgi:rhodanese-related sulfurtransferase